MFALFRSDKIYIITTNITDSEGNEHCLRIMTVISRDLAYFLYKREKIMADTVIQTVQENAEKYLSKSFFNFTAISKKVREGLAEKNICCKECSIYSIY